METYNYQKWETYKSPTLITSKILTCAVAVASIVILFWSAIFPIEATTLALLVSGTALLALIASLLALFLLLVSPDVMRARQTDAMLRMSRTMVDLLSDGMTPEAAQAICKMLLPNTAAIAVAITDTKKILGYSGYRESANPQGASISTQATHDALEDGKIRVIKSSVEIGLPKSAKLINAAIIVPIIIADEIRGTLKFYYKRSFSVTETQRSIAQGLGALISTVYATVELEKQRELATSMELKMLQSQINPHFLFNTINTIASLIRTDAPKARVLLRDFAVFYRSTLENSQERISLSKEIEQTQRYFSFEIARFGEEKLAMEIDLTLNEEPHIDVNEMLVPPFLLQPLVENSVKHAMPADRQLIVSIRGKIEESDVILYISDDGIGMTEEQAEKVFQPNSETGLGIAAQNVRDRMLGYYGPAAEMLIESKLGEGTSVILRFPNVMDELRKTASEMKGSEEIKQRLSNGND